MLKREENELVTRVSPGTPMGDTMRRYWMPALLSSELPHPDSDPLRLRLPGRGEGRHRVDLDGPAREAAGTAGLRVDARPRGLDARLEDLRELQLPAVHGGRPRHVALVLPAPQPRPRGSEEPAHALDR